MRVVQVALKCLFYILNTQYTEKYTVIFWYFKYFSSNIL